MIISISDAKEQMNLDGWSDSKIKRKLDSIEAAIRQYCNNNFQNRNIRCTTAIVDGILCNVHKVMKAGDTVQISASKYNNGLYVLEEVDGLLVPDRSLTDEDQVTVTKIEYPADIIDSAYDLLEWESTMREKVGISSEQLSRHTVTYFANDASNTVEGYPAALFGRCKKYRKVRC